MNKEKVIEKIKMAEKVIEELKDLGAITEEEMLKAPKPKRIGEVMFSGGWLNFDLSVAGDTYQIKDKLKAKGFRWDINSQSWSRIFKVEEADELKRTIKELKEENLVDIIVADKKYIKKAREIWRIF